MLRTTTQAIVRFGTFEADIQAGELRRNGVRVKLQEQPFQILAVLLEKPAEIVTREELCSQLWPADTFVDFDHSLNAAIKRLRDALGDSADNPVYVETVARRGYRFIAPIHVAENGTPLKTSVTTIPIQTRNVVASGYLRAAAILIVLLAGTSAGWIAARHFNPNVKIGELLLTANHPDDPVLNAVISPDGKYLCFAGRKGLFLRLIKTGETQSVQLPEGFLALPISWFPDGSRILANKLPGSGRFGEEATGSTERPSVWSISVMGGNPRKIMDNAEVRSLSPDGSQIVFVRGDKLDQEIWISSVDGERPRKITGGEGAMFGSVTWSPEGKHFGFVRYLYHPGSHSGFVTVEICESAANKINVILSDVGLGDALAWAPDGRLVYALAEPPPNRGSNLWAMRVNLTTGQPIGEASRLTNSADRKMGLSISNDGKSLVFLKWSGAPHIYVAQIEPHTGELSTPRRLSLDEGQNFPFAWTADGKSVIFTSDRSGPSHVFKQTVDQAAPDLLVGGNDSVNIARLNPDGTQLIYLLSPGRSATTDTVRVMRMPVSGGSPQLILQEPGVENFQCAHWPSTLCVFSQSLATALRFVEFNPENGEEKELIHLDGSPGYKYNWTLSPDGSTIAAAQWRSNEIHLLSTKNKSVRTLKVQGWASIATLDWAANGRSIWASSTVPSGAQVLLNIDMRGKIKPVLQDMDKDVGWGIPSYDGRSIALWEASSSANAWALENF